MKFLNIIGALSWIVLPASLWAQMGMYDQPVTASLVSEQQAIVPGQSFTVALRLDHQENWHTYWQSSSTGYATSIAWDLPAGFSAGEIQWPVPKVYVQDFIVDYVHDGITHLLIDLTAPANLQPGQEVTLRANVGWLMCEDICIPGEAALSLALPVVGKLTDTGYSAHAEAIQIARAELPREPQLWKAHVEQTEEAYTLTLRATSDKAPALEKLYFFSDNGLIEPEPAQTLTREGDTYSLQLPISSYASGARDKLTGVLKSYDGWGPATASKGLLIDLVVGDTFGFEATEADTGFIVLGETTAENGLTLWTSLGFALLGGLILNLMPCVFPVLGIKIMGFVNQGGQSRQGVLRHGLSYTIGVLVSFWALATLILILRSTGTVSGWGFQFQSPEFVFIITAIILLFGLNMSGVFEIGQGLVGTGSGLQQRGGLQGSFFSGVLATIVATPCSAPFLGAALGVALASPAINLVLILTAVGVGLALPYLLLSIFPKLVKYLPKPGAWMESFKQFMAFLLYATVAYLIWVASAQLSNESLYGSYGFLQFLFALVAVALAAWVYGRWTQPHRSTLSRRIGMATALAFLLVGMLSGWPQAESTAQAQDFSGMEAPPVRPALRSPQDNVYWSVWQPGLAEELAAEGHTVYVDFTAKWCVTCQTNKATVFASEEVRETFAEQAVIALRADWTNSNPAITKALQRFNRAAVPLNVVYQPGQSPRVLPSILTPAIVLQAVARN